MEAMAAGLPVIADNFSGPKDRVTPETGWLCNSWNDYLDVITEIIVEPKILEIKGKAAREHAKKEFVPERWIEEILK
jgi:glycosyltransferase involved in cell wall biosynthesis